MRSYLGLNSFLNLLNRWALGLYGLRFPLVMTASHMIFGACALMPMMMLNSSYRAKHQVSSASHSGTSGADAARARRSRGAGAGKEGRSRARRVAPSIITIGGAKARLERVQHHKLP